MAGGHMKGEIARRMAVAMPKPGRRAAKARTKGARPSPPQRPVVESMTANAGATAAMRFAIDRIDQLLDRWTERDPATIAGAYYHDLLNLSENLSIHIGE